MSRPKKQTVDYFPHDCSHKKTMFILEQRYGNNGYSFWFKLLEMLGNTEGHFIDLNKSESWEFLQAITRLDDSICKEILDLLAKLDAIDNELWENKIIWSENFIERITFVYSNRRVATPTKPNNYKKKPQRLHVSTNENPQSKVKYSKVKESKVKDFEVFWKEYPKKVGKGKARDVFNKIIKITTLDILLTAIDNQSKSEQWTKDNGQFIPNPATWLNQERWEDEIQIKTPEKKKPTIDDTRLANLKCEDCGHEFKKVVDDTEEYIMCPNNEPECYSKNVKEIK
jgi:hypothetical protein